MKGAIWQLPAAYLIWSSWLIPVRTFGQNAFTLSFYACLFASFVWGMFLMLKPEKRPALNRQFAVTICILSLCFVSNFLTYLGALKFTTASVAVLTHYTAPVFVAILSPFLLGEKITRRILTALAIAIAGFVIMLMKAGYAGDDFVLGFSLGLLSGLFYAFSVILSKRLLRIASEESLLFFQNAISVLFLLFLSPYITFDQSPAFLGKMLFISLLYSCLASIFYLNALKRVQGVKAAIVGYLEPLGTIIWGALMFSEPVTMRTIAGGALILYSGYYITRNEETETVHR